MISMKARIIAVVMVVALCATVSVAFAGRGNDMPSGPHYNLNILASKTEKDVGNSMGHTLFVKFNGKTRIYMTQAEDGQFVVTDRDGTDGTASFNIAPGHYDVFARALGKPGPGGVHIESWGEFEDWTGSVFLKLGEVDLTREKGKPQTVNINRLFYVDVTLCLEYDEVSGTCTNEVTYTNEWVFDIEELLQYYWEYYNVDVKLVQVRFYPRD
jgi:hypothetical protein